MLGRIFLVSGKSPGANTLLQEIPRTLGAGNFDYSKEMLQFDTGIASVARNETRVMAVFSALVFSYTYTTIRIRIRCVSFVDSRARGLCLA